MNDQDKNNYFFLNTEGRWPGFELDGLELGKDGALRLSSLPLFSGTLADAVKNTTPDGPAGLALDCYGSLYFSGDPGDSSVKRLPDKDRITRIDGCDSSSAPLPCVGGSGARVGQFSAPRGLFIPHGRHSLFVVDSDNHRIQIFDLQTRQLVEVWGTNNPGAMPQPGSAPGEFNTPWTLAGDLQGNVYVVDYGNKRVQKFNAAGDVVPSFAAQTQSSLQQPADIAVREQGGATWIFVLDTYNSTIFVFDQDGNPVRDSQGNALAISDPALQKPMGLAAAGEALYVGDNASRRIFRFQIGETVSFIGEAIGYDGPVAALLLDGKGGLLVHPGGTAVPVLLQARGGYRTLGALLSPAIHVAGRQVVWHRLQALIEPLKKNAHLDVFVYVSCDENDVPDKADLAAANPFADPRWNATGAPNVDVTDLFIGVKNAKCKTDRDVNYLWIGALFSGDGTASPVLSQLRVEFDYPTYDQYLPAIYRDPASCGGFLLRLLSLCESFNQEVEGEIAAIPALFDPKAAPKKFLVWLAGLLGLELDQNWDEQKQRRMIAEIFRLSGRRGTAAGLRESLRLFAGVDAVIEEPILHASWWALPGAAESCCESCAAHSHAGETRPGAGDSILGWTTMLAPAQPQGAVVGTSSDLDQSHLITNDDFGSPLFIDVAYRFTVNVYRGQIMCEGVLPRIRAVLEQEKPAHTTYELCFIEPRFRVGFQSRVGIDTVVAGPQRSLALGSGQLLGEETVLAGEAVSRLGMETRLGVAMRLG